MPDYQELIDNAEEQLLANIKQAQELNLAAVGVMRTLAKSAMPRQAKEIVGKGNMREQIRQVCENLRTALAAAGATLADLIRTQTFTTDIDAFFAHVDVRMEYFGAALPTSTTVEVRRLSHPDFLVEVEAIAALPAS